MIQFYAEDRAGSKNMVKSEEFAIDLSVPVIEIIVQEVICDEKSCQLWWMCNDDGSGLDHFEILVDDGRGLYYGNAHDTGELINLPSGDHTVYLTAFDCAGNSVTTSFDYNIADDDGNGGGTVIEDDVIKILAIVAVIAVAAIIMIVFLVKRK